MKQIIVLIIIALTLTACTQALIGNVSSQSDKPVVKIGVITPLSGDVAFLGEGMRDSVLLAIENLGETKYEYELVFEDDQLNPARSATAAQKLTTEDNVDALLSLSSGTGNVITPIAQEAGVIHIGIASDPNVALGEFNFIHWTPPAAEATAWVTEAKSRGYKRVAIIDLQHAGAKAVVDEVLIKAKAAGIDVVSHQTLSPGETDFRTVILKAKATNPDAYMLIFFDPEMPLAYKQMQELGITKPITSIEAYELSADPSLFEGQWYVMSADADSSYASEYEERFGKIPTLGAPNAYDAVNLIVYAYENTASESKPTTTQAANTLAQLQGYVGVLGELNADDEGIIVSPAAVRTIREGKPVTLQN